MTAAAVPAVRVDAFGLTDPGTVRQANEDHFAIVALQTKVGVDGSADAARAAADSLLVGAST